MRSITEIRAEFTKLLKESEDLVELCRQENREFTTEERAEQDKRFTTMTKLSQESEVAKMKFGNLIRYDDEGNVEVGDDMGGTVDFGRETPGREEYDASEGRAGARQFAGRRFNAADRAQFSRAMNSWATSGNMARQFATITTASQSGIFLPREVLAPLVPGVLNTLREALAIYGLQPVGTPTAADINIPVLNPQAGGEVAQNASSETENPPELDESFALNVKTYQSGSAWFSNQQLMATGFDLVAFIEQDLQYQKELAVETAALTAIIADSAITQVVTTATTSGFTYANLVSLDQAAPKKYQRQKVILLSAAAFTAAAALVGSDGHPILMPDPQNQSLMRFNGTPVLRCDDLEALTANKTVGLCISLVGFKLRDVKVQELHRYDRVPARPAQTGFNLFGMHGWGYAPSAIAKLKTPAS